MIPGQGVLVLLFASLSWTSATENIRVGDMILTPDQFNQLPESQKQGVEIEQGEGKNEEKRNAIRDEAYRWPGGVIPYEFDGSFSRREMRVVERAMNIWSKYTCVSFRPALPDDVDKILIMDGLYCSSMVGMMDGTQEVRLKKFGCRDVATVLHELGHAIGLYHTQTRPDRDRHLIIDLSSVGDEDHYNFEKHVWEHVHHYGVKYDYHSIMHYSSKDFGDKRSKVIRTKNPKFQKIIGQAVTLSFGDIEMVYKMYNCTPPSCKLKDSDCPGISFVDASCTCLCPGPNKFQLVQPCEGSPTGGNDGDTSNESTTTQSPTTIPSRGTTVGGTTYAEQTTTAVETTMEEEGSDPNWTPEQTTSMMVEETTQQGEETSSRGSDPDWTPPDHTTEVMETSSENSNPDWTSESTPAVMETSLENSDPDWTPAYTSTEVMETTSENSDPDWTPGMMF